MFYFDGRWPSIIDIEEQLSKPAISSLDPLRILVLRNVTVESIEPYYRYFASELGFNAEVMFGGFDSFVQESLGSNPELFQGALDVVSIFTPLAVLSASLDAAFAALSTEQLEHEINRINGVFQTVVTGIRKQTDATILWHGLETHAYPELGIYDAQIQNGQYWAVSRLNDGLRQALNAAGNAFFVNTEAVRARLGVKQFYDLRYWHLARAPYSRSGLAELASEDFKFVRSLNGRIKKCLVLDCDNTLWGGVIGEDGVAGIKLGSVSTGTAFVEFQQAILSLFHRGVILALCSKNNELDVWEVFDRHPDMVLKREHIAAYRINWEDKASNLRAIAQELNIGLDSLVFVDDSDFEINLIRQNLPVVQAVQLPKDRPNEYRWILAATAPFDQPYLTDEDRHRGAMYQAQSLRRQDFGEGVDLEAYCRSLEMRVEIGFADALTIPRIAQQTQKTNQFNLTTRRYSEADIVRFSTSPGHQVLWLKLVDKFGDLGIVGSCILECEGKVATIDTLLLSCRALGRDIERVFLHEILGIARLRGARAVWGQFIPTSKNMQVTDFYIKNGFVASGRGGKPGVWSCYDLSKLPNLIEKVVAEVRVLRNDSKSSWGISTLLK